MIKKILLFIKNNKYINNKYVIAFIVFVIFTFFLSQFNIFKFIANKKINKNLKEQKEYYIKQIDSVKTKLLELKTNKFKFEKFIREEFFMKKTDEDLFIIIDSTQNCNKK
ncbi:MAG: hypothetical protein N3A01_05515 [Bacteroidales bacterium]|nr:hypothetical protein [Bacteroidales bacterium]